MSRDAEPGQHVAANALRSPLSPAHTASDISRSTVDPLDVDRAAGEGRVPGLADDLAALAKRATSAYQCTETVARYSQVFGERSRKWVGWVMRDRFGRAPERSVLVADENQVVLISSDAESAGKTMRWYPLSLKFHAEPRENKVVINNKKRDIVLIVEDPAKFEPCVSALAFNSIPSEDRVFEAFYLVADMLGTGTSAQVWKCRDVFLGEDFAVKIVSVHDEAQAARELQEIQVMCRVRHPNVLRLFDVFLEKGSLYLVVELMDGGELFDLMAAMGSFSECQARHVMRQIFSALTELHSHGVIHRDLKPENILCGSTEWPVTVKVSDFGTSRLLERAGHGDLEEAKVRSMAGTVAFMAPEIVRGEAYTAKVDIWAAGCVLYMMLSGAMPFPGGDEVTVAGLIEKGPQLSERVWEKDISRAGRSLVRKLMDLEPERRADAKSALGHVWMTDLSLPRQSLPYDPERLAFYSGEGTSRQSSRRFRRTKSRRRHARGEPSSRLSPPGFPRVKSGRDLGGRGPAQQSTPALRRAKSERDPASDMNSSHSSQPAFPRAHSLREKAKATIHRVLSRTFS